MLIRISGLVCIGRLVPPLLKKGNPPLNVNKLFGTKRSCKKYLLYKGKELSKIVEQHRCGTGYRWISQLLNVPNVLWCVLGFNFFFLGGGARSVINLGVCLLVWTCHTFGWFYLFFWLSSMFISRAHARLGGGVLECGQILIRFSKLFLMLAL